MTKLGGIPKKISYKSKEKKLRNFLLKVIKQTGNIKMYKEEMDKIGGFGIYFKKGYAQFRSCARYFYKEFCDFLKDNKDVQKCWSLDMTIEEKFNEIIKCALKHKIIPMYADEKNMYKVFTLRAFMKRNEKVLKHSITEAKNAEENKKALFDLMSNDICFEYKQVKQKNIKTKILIERSEKLSNYF